MNRTHRITLVLAATGLALSGAFAYARMARSGENHEITALDSARINLVQAIQAAEAKVPGRALRAELGDENGKVIYEVEVVDAGRKVFDVKLDPATGNVLSSEVDRPDREHDEED